MYKFTLLPYVNAAPLVHFVPEVCPDDDLIYRNTRETLYESVRGRADASIIPVVDYLDTLRLEMIESLGICADGHVESVLPQSKSPLEEVKAVNLDPTSTTSRESDTKCYTQNKSYSRA